MEQHYARSCGVTSLKVMKPHAFALDETTDWWVPPFSHQREHDVPDHQKKENTQNDDEGGCSSGHSLSLVTQPTCGKGEVPVCGINRDM
jgi:hypothetical protein